MMVMKAKKFLVSDRNGGYANEFEYMEAIELARDESKNGQVRLVSTADDNTPIALFFEGDEYFPTKGKVCESCGEFLDRDDAKLSFELTGHYFCSQSCGVELGVLKNRWE